MASSDEEEEKEILKVNKKRRKLNKNEFIDDEAELSGDDEVSEDEADNSDQDEIDLDLVDQEAPELDSDQEEEVRGLYHKQLESEDKRAVLLLQEQLEDKDVSIGQRRRRKFRWQTKEFMENALKRHYDPDDDDSQDCDDEDEDDFDEDYTGPKLRRPTAEQLLIGSTRVITKTSRTTNPDTVDILDDSSNVGSISTSFIKTSKSLTAAAGFNEDSNSNATNLTSRLTSATTTSTTLDMNRFVFRDKEIVEALSTKETVVTSREERDRQVQREIKRVLQSKSIFDQLYS